MKIWNDGMLEVGAGERDAHLRVWLGRERAARGSEGLLLGSPSSQPWSAEDPAPKEPCGVCALPHLRTDLPLM